MGFAKKAVKCRTLLCTLYRVFHNSIHRLLPHLQSCIFVTGNFLINIFCSQEWFHRSMIKIWWTALPVVAMYIWMYYNCLFKTWTNIVIQTKVPYFRPARFWWVFLLVLLVVVVTGVKQSQLLVFKTWTKTGVWQKNSRYKNFGFKKLLFQKN